MDDSTINHLIRWIDTNIDDPEKEIVYSQITHFVNLHPDVIEKGFSWPTIQKLAERG